MKFIKIINFFISIMKTNQNKKEKYVNISVNSTNELIIDGDIINQQHINRFYSRNLVEPRNS